MAQLGEDILGLDFGAPVYTPFSFDEEAPLLPATRAPLTPWPSKLPFDIALGVEPTQMILDRYGVTDDVYAVWSLMPSFRRALSESMKEMNELGIPFRILCKEIAKDFLSVIDKTLHDEQVGFAAKMDAFKHITKLAGLEPQPVKEAPSATNAVQININL